MAATLTKIAGPAPVGPGIKMCVYTMAWDNSYPTGGEAIDITGEFDYVYGIAFGGNDTAADNGYTFSALLPGATTAVTSSNVKIQAHWDGDPATDTTNPEVANGEDLETIGATSLVVIGA